MLVGKQEIFGASRKVSGDGKSRETDEGILGGGLARTYDRRTRFGFSAQIGMANS